MSLFDIEITVDAETTTARLSGEIDMAAVEPIEEALGPGLDPAPAILVIDLRAVTFFDSSALRLVLRLDRSQREQGRRLVIVPGERRVTRVFELTGVAAELEFAPGEDVPAEPA